MVIDKCSRTLGRIVMSVRDEINILSAKVSKPEQVS